MTEPESGRAASSKVGQAIFLLAGVVALAIGVWQGYSTARFKQRALTATGRVLGDNGASSGEFSAHPGIEFRTATGALVRYRQNGMGGRPVGATMPVLYDPADPAGTAVVSGFWTLWFPAVGPLLMGALFVAVVLGGAEIGVRGARP